MRPEPPHLMEAAAEWSAEEIYWIVENGIKIGMPAFGSHYGPQEIAALTDFVRRLPGLSPEDYAAMTGDGGAAGTGGPPEEASPAEGRGGGAPGPAAGSD